jgi:hypothetical protein
MHSNFSSFSREERIAENRSILSAILSTLRSLPFTSRCLKSALSITPWHIFFSLSLKVAKFLAILFCHFSHLSFLLHLSINKTNKTIRKKIVTSFLQGFLFCLLQMRFIDQQCENDHSFRSVVANLFWVAAH